MTPSDLPAIVEIEQQVQPFPWREGHFSDSLAAGHLCQVLVDGNTDEILAYAILMPLPEETELLTIAVSATRQRQGLGQALLRTLIDAAMQAGHQAMFLEVAGGNQPARRLYARLGFEQVGCRKNYYRAEDGSTDDAWVMRLALHPEHEGTRADGGAGHV